MMNFSDILSYITDEKTRIIVNDLLITRGEKLKTKAKFYTTSYNIWLNEYIKQIYDSDCIITESIGNYTEDITPGVHVFLNGNFIENYDYILHNCYDVLRDLNKIDKSLNDKVKGSKVFIDLEYEFNYKIDKSIHSFNFIVINS